LYQFPGSQMPFSTNEACHETGQRMGVPFVCSRASKKERSLFCYVVAGVGLCPSAIYQPCEVVFTRIGVFKLLRKEMSMVRSKISNMWTSQNRTYTGKDVQESLWINISFSFFYRGNEMGSCVDGRERVA